MTELEQRVLTIVAEALDRDPTRVRLSDSLIDDLGAESIDFLDIVFRLESAFEIKIPTEEIWAGTFRGKEVDQRTIDAEVAALRERTPEFNWARFTGTVGKKDLPRLISVQTIVDYLGTRIEA